MTTDQVVTQKLEQHTSDISVLTQNVNKLALIVEYAGRDRKEDRETMKAVAKTLSTLSDKIQGLILVEEEIGYCKEELRVVKHDYATMKTVVEGLLPLLERTKGLEIKVEGLESTRDKMGGGMNVAKIAIIVFWTVFGSAILAGLVFIAKMYFHLGAQNVIL